jgi:hypothetical protein
LLVAAKRAGRFGLFNFNAGTSLSSVQADRFARWVRTEAACLLILPEPIHMQLILDSCVAATGKQWSGRKFEVLFAKHQPLTACSQEVGLAWRVDQWTMVLESDSSVAQGRGCSVCLVNNETQVCFLVIGVHLSNNPREGVSGVTLRAQQIANVLSTASASAKKVHAQKSDSCLLRSFAAQGRFHSAFWRLECVPQARSRGLELHHL